MKTEITPPSQRIAQILKELKLSSIDDLISGDAFPIETLAKGAALHPNIIRANLKELHELLSGTPTLPNKPSVKIDNIIKKWLYPFRSEPEAYQQKVKLTMTEGEIVEIVGRVGGGKSYFLNEVIIECLLKQIEIIYLDGSDNLNTLLQRIKHQAIVNPNFCKEDARIRSFSFKTQTQMLMTLHALGNWNAQNPHRKPWIFIDSLIRSDQTEIQNGPSINTLQFKSAEKIKRMLFQLSQLTGAIVFTTKCMNLNGLFEAIYKHEKHRPKGVGACSKQWDNVANKTICVDYGRALEGSEYFWMNLPKDPDCSIYKFKRHI